MTALRDRCETVPTTPEDAAVLDIGRRRGADFLARWAQLQWPGPGPGPTSPSRWTMLDLLAFCYLQGVRDSAQALVERGWTPPA